MASSQSPSSSSLVPRPGWKHDVFLSFRGEDTRYNFVDHLYTALIQHGIDVFKDDKTLPIGQPISPELLKAIEESRFAVVVFSEKYAESSWCLEELCKIMECKDRMGLRVLPVMWIHLMCIDRKEALPWLLSNMIRREHHVSMINDPEDGAEMIETRFCNKKVLLVLDDVNQLDFLAARHEWFGPGSRIVITTRDEHLPSDTDAKYKPPLLLMEQAIELFSRHAFRKNSPPDEYKKLSDRATSSSSLESFRLWQIEQIHDSIKRNRQLEVIEAIFVPFSFNDDLSFSADVFESMKKLRLLHVHRKFTSVVPTILPDELRSVRRNDYPFLSLPVAHMDKLVHLELCRGQIQSLWNGQKIMPNLKFIHLEMLNHIS
ncbi:hypothetical protein L1987_39638 [Smallanthus sonchifolius]|uniref:Uncharacterized protein n=1 Tax=Smallanthus sonchifolius TaxID=185202 RepID=A0ACB9HNR8_9ASTR|nr:hypothetical protein L1987_39638 [Smallanthus sonchifolius]